MSSIQLTREWLARNSVHVLGLFNTKSYDELLTHLSRDFAWTDVFKGNFSWATFKSYLSWWDQLAGMKIEDLRPIADEEVRRVALTFVARGSFRGKKVEFPACIIHEYNVDGKICGGAIYYEGHQLVDQTSRLEHMRGIPA